VLKRQGSKLAQRRSGAIGVGAQDLDRRLLLTAARVALSQQQRQTSLSFADQIEPAAHAWARRAVRTRRQPGHRHRTDPQTLP
jgi:hypothetical protein